MSKLTNEYADVIFTDDMPKSVLAAIVVSLLSCGGDHLNDVDRIREQVATEWQNLYTCGIVPQKPRGKMVEYIKSA